MIATDCFDYLIKKIENADFEISPFQHIYIEDFFSQEHFEKIISCEEIASPNACNDEQLLDGLYEKGFKAIPFPGCVTDRDKYIKWHTHGKKSEHHTACEGFGMALRLYNMQSEILIKLNDFLTSDRFNKVIAKKFNVDFQKCMTDGGIQKYLDGYEISPHPDIRKKAATFMVNINPSTMSESLDHHTHYLKFNPEKEYVRAFWEGNPDLDRAWVPWSWATTVKQQTKNNSIVLFSPANDTMHGVKANYNHLITQRTQLYGNLWYKESIMKGKLEWESLDLSIKTPEVKNNKINIHGRLSQMLPSSLKNSLKKLVLKDKASENIGKRKI